MAQARWGSLSDASHAYPIAVINSQQLSEMEFFIVHASTYLFPSSNGKFNELTNMEMERIAFFKVVMLPNQVPMTHFGISLIWVFSNVKCKLRLARAT